MSVTCWEKMGNTDHQRLQSLAWHIISKDFPVERDTAAADVSAVFTERGFCLRKGKTPLDFLMALECVELSYACADEVEFLAKQLAEVIRLKES
jgi:hypothetical protein